jgi:regulator of sirC expression with transglutaminase-like and TPR domain
VDPTTRFRELVESPDPPLHECALLIAVHDHFVHFGRYERLLDGLAARMTAPTAEGICRQLFVDEGYAGNRTQYYNPDNSFLDMVIEMQKGIPLTLSMLAIEVGRRVGVGMVGVGMPGHFLVGDSIDRDAFFDPFTAGVPLDRAGCEARLQQVAGPAATLGPNDLDPVTTVDMLTRMLANLHRIYLDRGDQSSLAWVLRLRVALPGADPRVRRQLAGVLATSGRFWEAATELEHLAAEEPSRATEHLQAAERLRARLN